MRCETQVSEYMMLKICVFFSISHPSSFLIWRLIIQSNHNPIGEYPSFNSILPFRITAAVSIFIWRWTLKFPHILRIWNWKFSRVENSQYRNFYLWYWLFSYFNFTLFLLFPHTLGSNSGPKLRSIIHQRTTRWRRSELDLGTVAPLSDYTHEAHFN